MPSLSHYSQDLKLTILFKFFLSFLNKILLSSFESETRSSSIYRFTWYKDQNNGVSLTLDFHPWFKSLNSTLQKVQGIVEMSSDCLQVLLERPMLKFCRPGNLKDHLVRS